MFVHVVDIDFSFITDLMSAVNAFDNQLIDLDYQLSLDARIMFYAYITLNIGIFSKVLGKTFDCMVQYPDIQITQLKALQ